MLAAAFAALAFGGDAPESKDHPLLTRYPGSEIRWYEQRIYERAKLMTDEKTERTVEGKLTRLSYAVSAGRTPLELARNYRDALTRKGFKVLWDTNGGRRGFGKIHQASEFPHQACLSDPLKPREYFSAELPSRVYVSVYALHCHGPARGPREVRALVTIVEAKQMEGGLIQVNADALAQQIAETGHASVYGILFDLNSAKVKPESKPVLDEVAKLLARKPALKLHVVGHTDNQGVLDYNLGLSRDRAQAVVSWLASQGVQASRLKAHGVGPLAPAASNLAEEGRSKNRRVELVEM
ncbi:MAG TPA: OmpA family protein [Bdellovibrionota bacterium]|nr:OmpA family protein [Bdellovibrionota bacterium]